MTHDLQHQTVPDAESWSHIQETITMLCLAVCQIETSMADSNESVDTLARSFTELAEHSINLDAQTRELQAIDELQQFKADMHTTATRMNQQIGQAITAFQFYDRISQRLDHVARSLEKVTLVMRDPRQLNSPEAWKTIQEQVRSSYTMEAERLMFEHIMRGASVEEALNIYRHHFTQADTRSGTDEVELF